MANHALRQLAGYLPGVAGISSRLPRQRTIPDDYGFLRLVAGKGTRQARSPETDDTGVRYQLAWGGEEILLPSGLAGSLKEIGAWEPC